MSSSSSSFAAPMASSSHVHPFADDELVLPTRTREQELDEAEMEAEAEGAADAAATALSPTPAADNHGTNTSAAYAQPAPLHSVTGSPVRAPSSSGLPLTNEPEYLAAMLAQLSHSHEAAHAPGAQARARLTAASAPPAASAHPSIRVHAVHGLDPSRESRATIEAKLEAIDQARKQEKRSNALQAQHQLQGQLVASGRASPARTATPSDSAQQPPLNAEPGTQAAADEAVLRLLALRKLQLLQQHLRCDNQPVEVLPATSEQGALFLGSVGASHHLPHLLAAGVTHILSVGRNLSQPFPDHFEYLYIPMLDSSTTRITDDIYEACFQFIEKGRRSTGTTRDASNNATAAATEQAGAAPATATSTTAAVTFPPSLVAAATTAAPVDASAPSSSRRQPTLHIHSGPAFPSAGGSSLLKQSMLSAAAGGTGLRADASVRAALARTEGDEGRVHSRDAATRAPSGDAAAGSNAAASTAVASAAAPSPSSAVRRGGVLVHCFAGKSRSTTIVLSYLMRAQGWSLEQAFAHVRACRPCVNPNPGFLLQLRELEHRLRNTDDNGNEQSDRHGTQGGADTD